MASDYRRKKTDILNCYVYPASPRTMHPPPPSPRVQTRDLRRIQKENEDLLTKCKQLESKVEEFQGQMQMSWGQRQELAEELALAQETCNTYQEQSEKLLWKVDELESDTANKDKTIADLQMELKTLKNTWLPPDLHGMLEQDLMDAEREIEKLQTENKEIISINKQNEEKMKIQTDELENASEEVQQLSEKYNSLKSESDASKCLISTLQDERTDLEKELKESQDAHSNMCEVMEKTTKKYESDLDALNQENVKLDLQIEEKESVIANMASEAERLRSQLEFMKRDLCLQKKSFETEKEKLVLHHTQQCDTLRDTLRESEANHQMDMDRLQASLSVAESQCLSKNEAMQALQGLMETEVQNLVLLTENHANMLRRVTQEYNKEKEELLEEGKQLHQKLCDLESEISTKEGVISDQREEIINLESSLKNAQKSFAETKEALEKERKTLQKNDKHNEDEMLRLKQELSDKDEEIKSLTEKVEDVDIDLKKASSELSCVKQELADMKKEKAKLENCVIDLKHEMKTESEKQEKDKESYEKKVKTLAAEMKMKVTMLSQSQNDVNLLMEEKDQLCQKRLKKQLQEHQKDIAELKRCHEKSTQELVSGFESQLQDMTLTSEKQQEAHPCQISSLQTQLADLECEISKKDGQISSLQTQLADLECEISKKDGQISSLQTQCADLECAISKKDGQISSLQTQCAVLECAISKKDGQISSLQTQLADLECEISKKDCQISSLQTQCADLECEINKKDCQISSLQTQLADLECEINKKNEVIKELKHQVLECCQEREQEKGSWEKLQAALRSEHQVKVSGLEEKLHKQSDRVRDLETQIVQHHRRIEEESSLRREVEKQVLDLTNEYRQVLDDMANLQDKAIKKGEIIKTLESQLAEKKAALEKEIKERLGEKESQEKTLKEQDIDHQTAVTSLEERLEQVQCDIETLRHQLTEEKHKAAEVETHRRHLETDLHKYLDQEKEFNYLKQKCSELSSQMKEERKFYDESLSEIKEEHNRQVKKLQEKYFVLEEKMKSLAEEEKRMRLAAEEKCRDLQTQLAASMIAFKQQIAVAEKSKLDVAKEYELNLESLNSQISELKSMSCQQETKHETEMSKLKEEYGMMMTEQRQGQLTLQVSLENELAQVKETSMKTEDEKKQILCQLAQTQRQCETLEKIRQNYCTYVQEKKEEMALHIKEKEIYLQECLELKSIAKIQEWSQRINGMAVKLLEENMRKKLEELEKELSVKKEEDVSTDKEDSHHISSFKFLAKSCGFLDNIKGSPYKLVTRSAGQLVHNGPNRESDEITETKLRQKAFLRSRDHRNNNLDLILARSSSSLNKSIPSNFSMHSSIPEESRIDVFPIQEEPEPYIQQCDVKLKVNTGSSPCPYQMNTWHPIEVQSPDHVTDTVDKIEDIASGLKLRKRKKLLSSDQGKDVTKKSWQKKKFRFSTIW